jgi:alkylation response protein AidB-like acyl-CoA dehydrogenase
VRTPALSGKSTVNTTVRGCWIRAGPGYPARRLPAETAHWSTITQIYEGTNQIQRVVMARQLLK